MSLRMAPPSPTALMARVISYALGVYNVYTGRMIVQFSEGLIGCVVSSSSALLKIQSDWRVDTPPKPHFSRKVCDRNFEMVICCCRNFKKSSFHYEFKGIELFLIVKLIGGQITPLLLPHLPFPKHVQ